jgi:Carboxypeptidase regulatory-like domain
MISSSFKFLFTVVLSFSGMLVNAQSMAQRDPTNRPVPLLSKSEKKRLSNTRIVHGIVKDEHDNAVNGALVNLKNLKTNQTLTFITKANGTYSFEELSRDDDYELSAAYSGKTTAVKKLSHYDSQTNSMRILTFGEPEVSSVSTSKK